MATMRWPMESAFKGQRAELYNNKIALYSGQNEKCFVTGKPFEIGDIHCHHKTACYKARNDKDLYGYYTCPLSGSFESANKDRGATLDAEDYL